MMKLEDLSCRRRVARLMDYLDRELPPSKRKSLAEHGSKCRSCACLLKSLKRTVAALRESRKTAKLTAGARLRLRARLSGP